MKLNRKCWLSCNAFIRYSIHYIDVFINVNTCSLSGLILKPIGVPRATFLNTSDLDQILPQTMIRFSFATSLAIAQHTHTHVHIEKKIEEEKVRFGGGNGNGRCDSTSKETL